MATDFDKAQAVRNALSIIDGSTEYDALTTYNGDPNGNVTATVGALCIDYSGTGKLYKNTDGSTGWAEIGTGATSSSGLNFITNPDFEVDTSGWSTYNDGAGTSPVDATGGSPTLTFTRSTSSPLRGTASGLITKDAANRSGEGISYDFTIESADKGKVLQISFEYLVGSGTFNAATSSTDSDITVWIYDVTNSVLIPTSEKKLYSNSTTIAETFTTLFQTSASSTSYRLIFHVATTNASAWTLKIDSVKVAPLSYLQGAYDTDWTPYTLTLGSDLGSPSSAAAFWKKKGGDLYIIGYTNIGTTGGGSDVWLGIPFEIDTSVVASRKTKLGALNRGSAAVGASGAHWHLCYDSALGTKKLRISTDTSSAIYSQNAGTGNFTNNELVIFRSDPIPIAGWGSSIQAALSGDDGRIVAARYDTSVSATASSTQPIQWSNKVYDTHNAVTTGSSWNFKVPVSGKYRVSATFSSTSNNTYAIIFVNGVDNGYISNESAANILAAGSASVDVKAGDTIDLRPLNSMTINSSVRSSITIERVGGNTVALGIVPKASLNAILSYTVAQNTSGQNSSGSFTYDLLNFNTEDSDVNNIVTLNSNRFIPIQGRYKIEVRAKAYQLGYYRMKLMNYTTTTLLTYGENGYTGGTNDSINDAFLSWEFDANGTDEFAVYMAANNAKTGGYGLHANETGVSEKYQIIKLEKI